MATNTREELHLQNGKKLQREKISIKKDELVRHQGKAYRILSTPNYDSIFAVDIESGRHANLPISALEPIEILETEIDINEISDSDWKVSQRRYSIIKPLLVKHGLKPTLETIEATSEKEGVSVATIYRWLKRFDAYRSTSALIPQARGWRKGKTRLNGRVIEIINDVIQTFYLTRQRRSASQAIIEVHRRCAEEKLPLPHGNTVRKHINTITEKDHLSRRGYRERAKNKFQATPGKFPNADYPLACVQIDHTPIDLILVDDHHRKPIGRPWITLAIDIYSRMVTGYYLSFDPPSETSVAMCVVHSILPKKEWLNLHEIDADWPVYGFMNTIHVDNAAEFRSNNFESSCLMHDIKLEFRPVRQPQYGGHIERLIGTFAKDIHELPGTTFSNIKDREGYDSEKEAVMTISEFEKWLVTRITKYYHQKVHSILGVSPIKQWNLGIFGDNHTQGVGIQKIPSDSESLLLDFLPSEERTVQKYGVTIDSMTYFDDCLRRWVNANDPNNRRKKRTFTFRRDPRNISNIWFFDPELNQYFKVPYADLSLPQMSLWEFNRAKALLNERKEPIDQVRLLKAITELRAIVEESSAKTKRARRTAQRSVEHQKQITPADPLKKRVIKEPIELADELEDGDISGFGGVQ